MFDFSATLIWTVSGLLLGWVGLVYWGIQRVVRWIDRSIDGPDKEHAHLYRQYLEKAKQEDA